MTAITLPKHRLPRHFLALIIIALFSGFACLSQAADHYWNFDDAGDRFLNSGAGGNGAATLGYYDPNNTAWGGRIHQLRQRELVWATADGGR